MRRGEERNKKRKTEEVVSSVLIVIREVAVDRFLAVIGKKGISLILDTDLGLFHEVFIRRKLEFEYISSLFRV